MPPRPHRVDPRQAVLGDRAAAQRRLAEQGDGAGLVLGDAGAVEEGNRVLDLGVGILRERRRREQPRRLRVVLLDAAAVLVERGEGVLGLRAAGLGRRAEQFCRASEILGKLLSFEVEQAEVIGRGRVAELRRFGKQPRRLRLVVQSAASGHVEQGEREHGVAVAAPGSQAVPFDRLAVVLGNADAARIEFPEQRHRAGIALLVDPAGRLGEGGEEIAALIGAVGEIGFDGRARRRGCRRSRGGGGAAGWPWAAATGWSSAAAGFGAGRRRRRLRGRRCGFRRLRISGHRKQEGARDERHPQSAGVVRHGAPPALPEPRHGVRQRRPDPARIVEHRLADGDEIGAGPGKGGNFFEPRGIGDAGYLEHLGPPFDPVDHGVEGRATAGGIRFAEHHVIGAGFARLHRLVAGVEPARAGDVLRLEPRHRLLERLDIAEMGAVGAGSGDDVVAVGEDQRHVAALDRGRDLLDEVDEAALVGTGEPQQHGGDIGARHGVGHVRHHRRPFHRRREQVEARKRLSWSRSR